MNSFEKFVRIRNEADRLSDMITNVAEVSGESGFRCLHVLWLYPDVMNIHGGRGDIMAILHMANLLKLPVEIRRCDNLSHDIDWEWPHIVFMTAGELKCATDVIEALRRQLGSKEDNTGLAGFTGRGGFFIANGSSGAVLADKIEIFEPKRQTIQGLGILNMTWKQRESVWGDDIWVKTSDGLDVIGNQISVADVELAEGQEPFGILQYGRGNNGIAPGKEGNGVSQMAGTGSGYEGARTGNTIYTGVLGPVLTKNPKFTASILTAAAEFAGLEINGEIKPEDIELELKSAEYIKAFMKEKQQ